MSLILEALRKSEAERQLGRPPGLLSPTAATASRPKRPSWIPLAMALLLMLLVLVAGASWWLGRQAAAPDPGAISAAPSAAPAGTPPFAPPPQPTPAAAQRLRPAASEPPPASAPPTAPSGAEPVADVRPAPRLPAPITAPGRTPPGTAPVATSGAVSDGTRTPVPQARIEHMPAADRARLPALKLSVHLYAAEPERRFAIIDGRRVTDSTSLAENLAVKAVVPEGVLLVFEGRTWLLPRP